MIDPSENTETGPLGGERLAAMLAHEVNNLMAPVLGRAQLALRDLSDTVATEKALSAAVASAQQASDIASALLDTYASPAAQAGVLLRDAVERAVLLVPTPRSMSLEIELSDAADVVVPGSIASQVLINLIRNAISAVQTVGGLGEIRIVACTIPATDRSTWNMPVASVAVMDTGPGIGSLLTKSADASPGAATPNSFESDSFELPGSASEGVRNGYGLGLSVCQQLTSRVGGSVELANRLDGPGAVATMLLPCSVAVTRAA